MTESSINFDAHAYFRAGKCPWTIFAFPASFSDAQGLPTDDDAKRYLFELQRMGLRVAVWSHPECNDTIYFACPYEDRTMVSSAIDELEREGTFPHDFASQHAEHLFWRAIHNI